MRRIGNGEGGWWRRGWKVARSSPFHYICAQYFLFVVALVVVHASVCGSSEESCGNKDMVDMKIYREAEKIDDRMRRG